MDMKGNLMVVLKTPFEIGGKEGRVSEKEEMSYSSNISPFPSPVATYKLFHTVVMV